MKKVYAHYRIDNMGTLHHSGGVTVYGEWEPETGTLTTMGAVCTLEDNYCYSRGRTIAEGRFNKYWRHNKAADIGSINVAEVYTALNSEEVHICLAEVATRLRSYIKTSKSGLSLRRYYRSVKKFEGE
jgi:hypothetical protein